jgi:hypothetical protein
MFIADLKGKLSVHEDNSEDFLTSCVFSVLDLLPKKWLKEYLEKAINIHGEKLYFNDYSPEIHFWKRYKLLEFNRGIEPDLLIFSDKSVYIIEAKFYSGKSGIGFVEDLEENYSKDNLVDQLSLEFFLGKTIVRNEKSNFKDFNLIYLTKDPSIPYSDINESIAAIKIFEKQKDSDVSHKIFWLNWQCLLPILRKIIQFDNENITNKKLSKQLYKFLEKRNLVPFEGFDFIIEGKYNIMIEKNDFHFYKIITKEYWSDKIYSNDLDKYIDTNFYNEKIKDYWEKISKLSISEKFEEFYIIIRD